jgi:hypothetical protein
MTVPSMCPKQRSGTVANGQQRSLTEVPDLRHRRVATNPTVLPKLAVLVRAGSARHKEPLVLGGHERSLSANENRRSEAVHRHYLGRRSSPELGSNPTSSAFP